MKYKFIYSYFLNDRKLIFVIFFYYDQPHSCDPIHLTRQAHRVSYLRDQIHAENLKRWDLSSYMCLPVRELHCNNYLSKVSFYERSKIKLSSKWPLILTLFSRWWLNPNQLKRKRKSNIWDSNLSGLENNLNFYQQIKVNSSNGKNNYTLRLISGDFTNSLNLLKKLEKEILLLFIWWSNIRINASMQSRLFRKRQLINRKMVNNL